MNNVKYKIRVFDGIINGAAYIVESKIKHSIIVDFKTNLNYSGFWIRLVAAIIDGLFLIVKEFIVADTRIELVLICL